MRTGNLEKFIPGTNVQFAYSANSLTIAMECQRKYKLMVVDGWRAKGQSMHLLFGIGVANALDDYNKLRYGQGATHEEALYRVVKILLEGTGSRDPESDEWKPWDSGDSKKNRDNLVRTVVWYLEKYKDDPAKVLMYDGKPAVEVPFSYEIDHAVYDGTTVVFNGFLDKFVEFCDLNIVVDQKTTGSTLGPYYFERYKLDNQVSMYTFSSQIITQKSFAGVMIDAMQIAVGFTAFDRGLATRTPAQLEEWLDSAKATITQTAHHAEDDEWPMNLTACNNFGKCQFVDICSKDPAVRENYLKTYFERRPTGSLTSPVPQHPTPAEVIDAKLMARVPGIEQ